MCSIRRCCNGFPTNGRRTRKSGQLCDSPSVSECKEANSGEEVVIAAFHSTVGLQEIPKADIAAEDYRRRRELLHGRRPPLRRGLPQSRICDYCVKYREVCLRMRPLDTPLYTSLKELEDVGMRGPLSVNLPVGGRLRHFWPIWHRMEANRRVVRWLKFGFPLRFDQS